MYDWAVINCTFRDNIDCKSKCKCAVCCRALSGAIGGGVALFKINHFATVVFCHKVNKMASGSGVSIIQG